MPKIVYAPILEQAGFLKRKAADVVEQWVAQSDGATQYWQLSEPIPLLSGYKVRYKINVAGGNSNVAYIHGNSKQSGSLYVYLSPISGQLSFLGSINEKLDGVPFVNNSEVQLGVEYEVEFEVSSNKDIATLFRFQDVEKYTAGYIYDLEVLNELGVVVNKIPLTNKAQGATQLATVGSINATMINYTGDEWEQLP
jgi:hypothetical protein